VLKPAGSISTAQCTRSAGTTLQRGLCPLPNHSCGAEQRCTVPPASVGGSGWQAEPPCPNHIKLLVPQRRPVLDLLSPRTQRPQSLQRASCMGLCATNTQHIAMAMADYDLISLNDFLSLNKHLQLRKEWKLLSSHHGIRHAKGLTQTGQISRDSNGFCFTSTSHPPPHPGYSDGTSGMAVPGVSSQAIPRGTLLPRAHPEAGRQIPAESPALSGPGSVKSQSCNTQNHRGRARWKAQPRGCREHPPGQGKGRRCHGGG